MCKLLTSLIVLVSGHYSMALIFSRSAETLLTETTNPRKWTYVVRNVHLLGLTYSSFFLNKAHT